ncbi:MAG: Bug family tripartite tricarboxylate transporter substrate binding protein [Burkholderiales bacterium]
MSHRFASRILRHFVLLVVAAGATLGGGTASAQAIWPQKPVQLIVPWPAGGGTDIIGRAVAQRLATRLGQSVVIENRAGASGNIGTQAAARAAPDGYTLVLGVTNTHAINSSYFRSLPYDPLKDFQAVTMLAIGPHVLVINANQPARNIAELVALLRAQPGKHAYASYGNGSTAHLLGEQLRQAEKLDLTHAPYRGIPPALQDLIGGQVSLLFSTTAAAIPQIRGGRLRALAITSEKRLDALPEVATMIELQRPDATLNHWYGLFAPAGTPRAIVDRLAQETEVVLQAADLREIFNQAGVAPVPMTPDATSAFVRSEVTRWGALVKAAGIVGE